MRFETLPLTDINLSELANTSYDTKQCMALSNKARTVPEVGKRLNDIMGSECLVNEASDELLSDIRELCHASVSPYRVPKVIALQGYCPTKLSRKKENVYYCPIEFRTERGLLVLNRALLEEQLIGWKIRR